ncbi:MAG: AraC family transcriptional regulator [Steroidobacteraceae bacterium]
MARQRWTTSDVEPRHALDYWKDAVCRSFLEIDIDSSEAGGFEACLEAAQFASGSLYDVQAGAQRVRRTPARIARSRTAWILLMQVRAGEALFRQYGRECALRAGDTVVVDCAQPYELDCLGATRSVMLRYPHDWLSAWLPSVESAAARVYRAGDGWGGALSAALAGLETTHAEPLALPAGVVSEQLASLVALAAGPQEHAVDRQHHRFRQLQDSLRERCHDSLLTPAAFAAAHGISRRYLHLLFARAGTTFGAELMRMRLEVARRLLADPRWSAVSVAEVAARCGFAEPSHFARRFRAAHGVAPQHFRRAQAAATAG